MLKISLYSLQEQLGQGKTIFLVEDDKNKASNMEACWPTRSSNIESALLAGERASRHRKKGQSNHS